MLISGWMTAPGPSIAGCTRRALMWGLLGGALHAVQKRKLWPSEQRRYLDPATEFTIERLTNPAYSSRLPSPPARAIARRGGFLLFSSERSGSWQLYRLDERSGQAQQLTQAAAVDPHAFTLVGNDDSFCYLDEGLVRRVDLEGLKERVLYRLPPGWRLEGGLSPSADGKEIALVETDGRRWVMRLIASKRGRVNTVLERAAPLRAPLLDPRRRQVLYLHQEGAFLCGRNGEANQRVPAPPGAVTQAMWSADGRAILYLHRPAEKNKLVAIREYDWQRHTDRLVAETSQFACFAVNSDGSVFVGASANVASPHVLLLLRVTRRELTLCEHRATDASSVCPTFSPDSRRLYFQSDREGKSALYRMALERLIEPTDLEPAPSRGGMGRSR